jgi:hypothetical protein
MIPRLDVAVERRASEPGVAGGLGGRHAALEPVAAAMARRVSTWSPSVTRPISLPLVGLMMSMVSRPWDSTNAPSI